MNVYRIEFNREDGPSGELARVLKNRIEARWDTEVRFEEPADLTFSYREGRRCGAIQKTENGYAASGAEATNLWDMAGRILRSAPAGGTFRPAPQVGVFETEKELCAMYFATHFHNYYHAAPLEELKVYVEDLALWGLEALGVWFDLHHYTGVDDPEAIKMTERLLALQGHARSLGLKLICTTLANEGFSTTPAHLKATNAVQNGYIRNPIGFYNTEICPATQEGMDLILKNRSAMLDVFAEVKPDYFSIWPYDQGGCTCKDCAPWGSRGFLKAARAEADLIRSRLPEAKIILSTWYFGVFYKDDTEWDDLYAAFERGEIDFADMIMADFPAEYPRYVLDHPQPLPVVSFNEFSMYGMCPWGGYGANPMPGHIMEQWNDAGKKISGGMPYSEGIYEDMNKAITLRLFREGKDPDETIREYLRYECHLPEESLDDGLRLIHALETAHTRDSFGFQTPKKTVTPWNTSRIEEAESLAEALNQGMTAEERGNIKWKMIYLRAKIDGELLRSNFNLTEAFHGYCDQLDEIYYTKNGSYAIRPCCHDQIPEAERRISRPGWKGAPVFWWETNEEDEEQEIE